MAYYGQHGQHDAYNNSNPYTDPTDAFNPYTNNQPHYDQGGYRYTDEASFNPHGPTGRIRERPTSMRSEFDDDSDDNRTPLNPASREKISRNQTFKAFRYDSRGNLWTRGSGWRVCGRFLGCTILIFIFLVLTIIMSLVLWVQPPNISIGNVVPNPQGGSLYTINNDGVLINLAIPISVDNPNYFSVDLKSLKVALTYQINNTPLGQGEDDNIDIKKGEKTSFNFPITVQYKFADDPTHQTLVDIGSKCVQQQNLNVNYKVTIGIKLVAVTISPTVSNSFSFACPLSQSDIESLLGQIQGGSGGGFGQ